MFPDAHILIRYRISSLIHAFWNRYHSELVLLGYIYAFYWFPVSLKAIPELQGADM